MTFKGLILFDWDKTIVDDKTIDGETTNINNSFLAKAIAEKIQQGWHVGLNSDTPLKRLQKWGQALGMNGPIIAERGGMVWWPASDVSKTEGKFNISKMSNLFMTFREEIILTLIHIHEHALLFGDSTEFIKAVSNIALQDKILGVTNSDKVLIALDAYRECSIGMFIRHVNLGNLQMNNAITENIQDMLSKLKTCPSQVAFDSYLPAGFLGMSDPNDNKSNGAKFLIENWVKPSQFIMIGDSMPDYLNSQFQNGVLHCAVGNANPKFKEIVAQENGIIASKEFANGCVEILSQIS